MKILAFNLLKVGPFTDVSLDLSAGQHGLHVILGPNEAGKSSSLRALRALLYGFPPQTNDNFMHDNAQLRVGATLRHSDGSELTVIRRKGNRDTLLSVDEKPIGDAALARFLGTVDAEQFTTFFGIGHEELRKGGEAILKGGAKVGESLFAAGAGGSRLRKLRETINSRAEELYKPRARTPRIAVTLAEHRDALKTITNLSASVEDWSKHNNDIAKAKNELGKIQSEIQTLTARRAKLERTERSIPLLARRCAALSAIAEIGEVPALPDDFSKGRSSAEQSLRQAEEDAAALKLQIAQLDAQINGFEIPEALFQEAATIDALYLHLRSYQQAVQQMPALRGRRDQSTDEARTILRGLRPELTLDHAEELRLSTARREQLHLLSREWEGLRQSLKSAHRSVADLEEEMRQNEAELSQLPVPRDPATLQSIIATVQKQGDLEKQVLEGARECQRVTRRCETDLKKLGLWSGTLEAMETLAIPSIESIELARDRQDKSQAECDTADREIRKLEDELARNSHEMQVLRATGELPTEAELDEVRQRRRQGWALVRQTLETGVAPEEELQRYTGGGDLAETYEKDAARADRIADALRLESSRVAQHATLVSQQRLTEERRLRERERRATAHAVFTREIEDWKRLWSPLGIDPLSPKEMSSWVTRQRELAQDVRKIREQNERLSELRQEVMRHRDLIVATLQHLNEAGEDDAPLNTVMALAERVIRQIRDDADERIRLQASLKKLWAKLTRDRESLSSAENELAGWRKDWEKAVAGLGVPADAEPTVAMAIFGKIDDLFQKIDLAREAGNELEAGQAQVELFEQQARNLAVRLAPDLASRSSDEVAMSLDSRLKKARNDKTRRDSLMDQRQQSQSALELWLHRAQAARDAQTILLRTALCENVEELSAVERKYNTLKEQTVALAQAKRELLILSPDESIDELTAQASALNADSLPGQLEELSQDLQRLENERTELNRTIGAMEEKLRRMDGNGRAAEAAESAQALLATLRHATDDYVRLKMAGEILDRGIERYRQRKQGPLLKQASDIFTRLTIGSFSGLQADFGDNDEPILVGIRGGKRLGVDEMSDGTRDQLYLSLRLATLEDYLDRSEPIPFVVDDILVHFDDARAKATLRILADVSKKTQVILFTHHAHIMEMAAEIGEGVYQTTLTPGSVMAEGSNH